MDEPRFIRAKLFSKLFVRASRLGYYTRSFRPEESSLKKLKPNAGIAAKEIP